MRIILCFTTLLLAACGGGGGGGGDTGKPSGDALLGTRLVPGWELRATAGPAVAGDDMRHVTVQLTPDAGQPAAQEVRVWIDGGNELPGQAAVPVVGNPGAWSADLAIPAGAGVLWVRVVDVDGNTVEAGTDSFPLTALAH